jgi:GNAT superfamily N-acetyltransferase
MSMFDPVRKLDTADVTDGFDSGHAVLNDYLQRFALTNQSAGMAQTYVSCVQQHGRRVVAGWYSLAFGSVESAAATVGMRQGVARHPLPVMVLARLAVDLRYQRQGLGRALLKDALLRTEQAADIAGLRALLVHAKDEQSRAWYASWDFEPSPSDSRHLCLLIKDLRGAL